VTPVYGAAFNDQRDIGESASSGGTVRRKALNSSIIIRELKRKWLTRIGFHPYIPEKSSAKSFWLPLECRRTSWLWRCGCAIFRYYFEVLDEYAGILGVGSG
jgi:hypothetical protein